ncbi:hypothetical protein GC101_33885 [Paenibacillus sp. LMG 31459]|uniref:Uncharacterized protein n=1 Tax=Paenibacillus phytohabitans TaxID=2654978 RepID=A0ABX1YSH5_9BACL|nr:hypothetical protein [Paenibacillus phytohabitans]NOU83846.1 hypothetical protein [Paenibacillus phytohabitans]
MKKLTAVLSIALLTTAIAPFASANQSNPTAGPTQQVSSQQEATNTYTYNGLQINSPLALSDEQLASIYSNVQKQAQSRDLITPFSHEIGGSGELVYGPKYETHTNKDVVIFATAATAWLNNYIYTKIGWNPSWFKKWVISATEGWFVNQGVNPTYTGIWTTRAGDPQVPGLSRFYLTLVHYTNNSFNTPISVQYNEVATEYNP